MISIRSLLTTAALLTSFLPPAFAHPPGAWQPPHPPGLERPDGPALGVLVEEIPFDKLDELDLSYGVGVDRVIPGGPAEKAGLQGGDILLEIDSQPVYSVPRLRWLVAQAGAESSLEVKYKREGTVTTVKITPRVLPAGPLPPPPGPPHTTWSAPGYLGVKLQSLTPGLREAFDVPENSGALVAEVSDDSPASRAGLRAGDVIVKMDRRTVRDIDDVLRVLAYFGPGESVKVEIVRDKQSQTLDVELGEDTAHRDDTRRHSWRHPDPESMPFFADPDWWQDMQEYMERWHRYLDESRDDYPQGRAL